MNRGKEQRRRSGVQWLTSLLSALLVMSMMNFSLFVGPENYAYADEDKNLSEELLYQNLFYYQLRESGLHITRAMDDIHYNDEGEIAFKDRCMIRELIIPDTLPVDGKSYPVEYIDGKIGSTTGAFYDCTNLSKLVLPTRLKELGDKAFAACTSLTTVRLPDGLEVIGCGAFEACEALTEVNIPVNARCGDYAGEIAYPGPFSGTVSLTKVTIAEGKERINGAMFKGSGLQEITIPDSVIAIDGGAFQDMEQLTKVNISKNSKLQSIGWSAFQNSGIHEIYLPDTVTFADVAAFAGCKDLKSVRIPKNLGVNDYQTERGYDTGIFNGCESLTDITFADDVETIGRCWFFDSPIESITIPASVKEIGESAFRYCLNLKDVQFEDPDNIQKIGPYAFRKDTALQEFDFPQKLKTIDAFAFQEAGLYEANLPSSLEQMNEGAFSGCENLISITFPAKMEYNGGNISGGGGTGAVEGCNALKEVNFEKGVKRIDDGLLAWNNGLVEITIPSGVESIGTRAFRRDYNLQKVTLPKSLKTIEPEAFSDCTALETLLFKGDRPTVEESICAGVTATVEFGVWDKIPDNWGGTLTFIGKTGKKITEEMLYGEYNQYLKNDTYKEMSCTLYDDMAMPISRRTDAKDDLACLKQNMREGIIGTGVYLVKSWLGISDKQRKKEMASELIWSLNSSGAGAEIQSYIKKKQNFNKLVKDSADTLAKTNPSQKEIEALAKIFGGGNAKKRDGIISGIHWLTAHEETFKKVQKKCKKTGRILTVADVAISSYLLQQTNEEIMNQIYGLLPDYSELAEGIDLIRKDQAKSDYWIYLRDYCQKIIESEGLDLGAELLTTKVLEAIGNPGLAEGAFGGAELFYWALSYALPGGTADELIGAEKSLLNAATLSAACKSYRTAIKINYDKNGGKTYEEMRANYMLLIEAYKASIENGMDKMKTFANDKEKAIMDEDLAKLGKKITYKSYIKSCLANANMAENITVSENEDGTVTITGGYIASGATDADDDDTTYVDIPAEVNGKPVTGIAENAFAGETGLSIVTIPDSVNTIGNGAFAGCSNLNEVYFGQGTESIGSQAFADCDKLDSVDLPDGLSTIEKDAFGESGSVEVTGAEGSAADDFAKENGYDFVPRDKAVKAVEITKLPTKTSYRFDEALDPAGMVLHVTYQDGTTAEITEGVFCWIQERKLGENEATALYGGCTDTFTVTITNDACTYTVYYEDEEGNQLRDTTSGTAPAGETVKLQAAAIEGYTPTEPDKELTIGEENSVTFTYRKDTGTDIAEATVKLESDDIYPYTGEQVRPKMTVTCDGKILIENTDYEVFYGENISSEGLIVIEGIGAYTGIKAVTFAIESSDYDRSEAWIYVDLWDKSFSYNGKVKTPGFSLTAEFEDWELNEYIEETLKAGTDYKVVWKTNRKSIGKHSGQIVFLGRYAGHDPMSISFTIVPAKMKLSSVKPSKKKMTVKYKAAKGGVKYQVAYRIKGKGKWKTKTLSKTKLTVKKLKKGKKYQVRVRAYKKVGSKTYYGAWSSIKTVKIK